MMSAIDHTDDIVVLKLESANLAFSSRDALFGGRPRATLTVALGWIL